MHPLVGCTRRALGVRCDDPALTRVLGAIEGMVRTLEKRHRVILGAQLCDAGGQEHLSDLADRPSRHRVLNPAVQLIRVLEHRRWYAYLMLPVGKR